MNCADPFPCSAKQSLTTTRALPKRYTYPVTNSNGFQLATHASVSDVQHTLSDCPMKRASLLRYKTVRLFEHELIFVQTLQTLGRLGSPAHATQDANSPKHAIGSGRRIKSCDRWEKFSDNCCILRLRMSWEEKINEGSRIS